jgi:hypothetical protein
LTQIYFALIIFPILFMIAMGFIYASSVAEIALQQVILNCPWPYNSAIAYANLTGTTIEVYNVTYDGSGSDYHVTTFHCQDANAGGLGPITPQVTSTVYTTPNNWYVVAGQAGGFLFVQQENIKMTFQKITAFGTLIQLFLNAPALVLAIPQYIYVNIILVTFVAVGGFMVIRGG